jgi:2'-5' RNA ligase
VHNIRNKLNAEQTIREAASMQCKHSSKHAFLPHVTVGSGAVAFAVVAPAAANSVDFERT